MNYPPPEGQGSRLLHSVRNDGKRK